MRSENENENEKHELPEKDVEAVEMEFLIELNRILSSKKSLQEAVTSQEVYGKDKFNDVLDQELFDQHGALREKFQLVENVGGTITITNSDYTVNERYLVGVNEDLKNLKETII